MLSFQQFKLHAREGSMDKDELRQALDALGWKQSELARKLGITAGAVSRWATGEPIPPWLAEYLRVMQELDRLHRQYVQPPRRVRVAAPAPDAGAPMVTGRAARMAKRVKALSEGGQHDADGDNIAPEQASG